MPTSLVIRFDKENIEKWFLYILLFYSFCLDDIYTAVPALNSIFNSKVLGALIAFWIAIRIYNNRYSINPLIWLLYLCTVVLIAISALLSSSNAKYIFSDIVTFHNIRLCVLLPLGLITVQNIESLHNGLYKFAYFQIIFYFFIYRLYFVHANIEGGYYANYGMYSGFVSTLFWAFIMQQWFIKHKLLDLIFSIVSAIFIISFGSRSVIIIMAVAFVSYLLIYSGSKNIARKIVISLLLVLVATLIYKYMAEILSFVAGLFSGFSNLGRTYYYLKNASKTFEMDGRDLIWGTSIKEIGKHPFFIRGICGDIVVLNKAIGHDYYAHNFILEILLEFGFIFGLAIVLLLLRSIIVSVTNTSEIEKKILIPILVVSFVSLFFSLTIWSCPWFWIYLLLFLSYCRPVVTANRQNTAS